MKTTIQKVVEAYTILGTTKTGKLEASEVITIARVRKQLRPTVESFNEYSRELHDKFKTQNLDAIIAKVQNNEALNESEQKEFRDYNALMNEGLNKEILQEVELADVPKISEETLVKLSSEGNWEMRVFELFEILL